MIGFLDIVLITFLCCLILATLVCRRNGILRIATIFVLLAANWVGVLCLFAFGPRWAGSIHVHEGKAWSSDVFDGIMAFSNVAKAHYPYFLLGSLGLALIALMGQKQRRIDDPQEALGKDRSAER